MISYHCMMCPNRKWYVTICISSTTLYFDMVCNFPLHISVLHIFYTFPPDGIMVLDRYNVRDRIDQHTMYDRVFNSETGVPIMHNGWWLLRNIICVAWTQFFTKHSGFWNTDGFWSTTNSSVSLSLRILKMFASKR